MRILIVDDQRERRSSLEAMLREEGHQVKTAPDGVEALKKLRRGGIDLVLISLFMPVMDGLDLCREIRQQPKLKKIPLILFSSSSIRSEEELLALRLGANHLIPGPCKPEVLMAVVEEVGRATSRRDITPVPDGDLEKEAHEHRPDRLVERLEREVIRLREDLQGAREREREARMEVARWKTAFDGMLDKVALLGNDGTVIQCNQAFADFLGGDGQTLVGQKCYHLVHGSPKPIESCPLLRSIESQSRQTLEMSVGGRIFLSVVDPVKEPSGTIRSFIHTLRDITEQKEVEEALKQSEEKNRTIAEKSLQALLIVQDFRIRYANTRCREVMGYEVEELLSLSPEQVVALVHPEDRDLVWGRFRDRIAGRAVPSCYEYRGLRKDGRTRWLEMFASLIEYRGKPAILAAVVDITDRQRAEERLREANDIMNRSPAVAFLWKNEEGWPVEFVSDNVREVFGYTAEEFLNGQVSYAEVIHPGDIDRVRQEVMRYSREDGRTEFMHEPYRIIDREGKVKWLEDRTAIRRDGQGRITHYQGIVLDITQRKRTEEEMASLGEQLRHAQKMEAVGRLAGGIAHDFNNVLTVMKGSCQLSLLDLQEEDPLYGNLKEIERCVDRAARLTQQLLAFSRKQILVLRVVDVNAVIEDLRKILQRILGEDVELVTYLEEGIGRVKADLGQMEQMIINLAINARDAMPRGGKLTIETAAVELDEAYARSHIAVTPGSYVMLSISDTGVGMTPEVKERIFEPFFTTKEAGKGTGLGLSTVYGIVKQSGGNIWVYTEVGRGTTFKIYLPRVDEPLDERKEESVKEVPQGSETIVVVEDEEIVRKLAARLLRKQGYQVLEAPDGGRAFMLCEAYGDRIDLILSDVVMPGMSGRQLVERLQKIHPEAKALYMSGYTNNVIVHHGVLEKGIDFIQKPFTLESLARKVREVIDKKKDEP